MTYGCNLALITYTITLTLIRLSLSGGMKDVDSPCKEFIDARLMTNMLILKKILVSVNYTVTHAQFKCTFLKPLHLIHCDAGVY